MPPPAMAMMLDDVDVDEEKSFSVNWSVDPSGTLRHRKTGLEIHTEEGISMYGQEYKLAPSDIELEDGQLGAGAGGVVKKGIIKTTGQQIAVKTVKVDDKEKRDQLLREIQGLVMGQACPNIVDWYAGFVNKKTNAVHVALEFMDLGSLRDLHKRAPAGQVPPHFLSQITSQVMMGLNFLHMEAKILHRDIKPENILHNRAGMVKLTDFGIAKDLDATFAVAMTFIGTAIYMSPERCIGEDYNFSADIWSVGMVIQELSTGVYPFADMHSFPALFQALTELPEPRLDEGMFPPPLCQFNAYCLTRDVSQRPDSTWLLTHPWLQAPNIASHEDLVQYFASLESGDN